MSLQPCPNGSNEECTYPNCTCDNISGYWKKLRKDHKIALKINAQDYLPEDEEDDN